MNNNSFSLVFLFARLLDCICISKGLLTFQLTTMYTLQDIQNIPNSKRKWITIIPFNNDSFDLTITALIELLQGEFNTGDWSYILLSNVEVGTNEKHAQYQKKHVHLYVEYKSDTTTKNIYERLNLNKFNVSGLWIQPKPIDDMYKQRIIQYCLKKDSKVQDDTPLFERGNRPSFVHVSHKRKLADEDKAQKIERRITTAKSCTMLKECIECDPSDLNYWMSGQGKSMFSMFKKQKRAQVPESDILQQQYAICGNPGQGKTHTAIEYYERILNKRVYLMPAGRFMDGYDPDVFDIILIDDMDAEAMKGFGDNGGLSRFKQMTDGKPFWYEEKHQPRQMSGPKVFIITSNISPSYWVDASKIIRASDHVSAICRRFKVVSLSQFMVDKGIEYDPNTNRVKSIVSLEDTISITQSPPYIIPDVSEDEDEFNMFAWDRMTQNEE